MPTVEEAAKRLGITRQAVQYLAKKRGLGRMTYRPKMLRILSESDIVKMKKKGQPGRPKRVSG